MKNLLVSAFLAVSSCTVPMLEPVAMAQNGPVCATLQSITDTTRARYPNVVVEEARVFTGHDADAVADAVDKVVPDDIDYDGLTSISVNLVEIEGNKFTVVVFLRDACVISLVRTDWETYQKALTLAFGPRA